MSADDAAAIDLIVQQNFASFTARPGIALSITGPRGYYHRAYGGRGPGDHRLSLDDHMRMGSITKQFTAMAIHKQVELGNLSYDDKLSTFVSGIHRGNEITIRHMLMMRSGIYEFGSYLPVQITNFVLSLTAPFSYAQALAIIQAHPSQFTPGTNYQYSNSNYVLLGRILEIVIGKPIRTILKEEVIDPLGLTETSWPSGVGLPSPFARGFGANILYNIILSIPIIGFLLAWLFGGPHREETYSNPNFEGAAGALVTTVGDLTKFMTAQNDEALLSDPTYAMWRTTFGLVPNPFRPGPAKFGYGMGLIRYGSWFGHDGSVPGYSSAAFYEPTSQATICAMENYQTPEIYVYSRLFNRIADYLYPGSVSSENYVYEVPDPDPDPPATPITHLGTVTDVEVPHETHTHYRTVLIGHGGGGGGGHRNVTIGASRAGGGGGGGAAVIDTGLRPISELGTTFSQTQGTGGLPGICTNGPGSDGTDGTASTFTSGDVELSAGGGGGGQGGQSADPTGGAGGAGGVATVTGISGIELQADGTAGATGARSAVRPTKPPTNTAGGAGGGGGGAGNRTPDEAASPGGHGGDSLYQVGGNGGSYSVRSGGSPPATAAGKPGAGGGGAYMATESSFTYIPSGVGGDANGYGGGGGGGAAGRLAPARPAGSGGPGYARTDFFEIQEEE